MMTTKISTLLTGFVFIALVPYLELGSTHLQNPHWPSHARLHEAWQLTSNAALAGLAIWLTWVQRKTAIALLIGLIITTSFLGAWATASLYDGSMLHTDGTQTAVGGINLGVLVVSMLALLQLIALTSHLRTTKPRVG